MDSGADAGQGLRRFVDTVEHLADSFTEIDEAWSITYMNRTGFAWSGLTEHDVIGRNFWDLYPSAVGTPFGEALRRVMASRISELFETTSSRSGRWFESNVFPSGNGIAVLSRDIDARKRDQAALREADRRKDEFLAMLAPRTAQPARADPQRAADRCAQRGRRPDAAASAPRRSSSARSAPGAAGRRPARRLAHHPRQARAAARARRPARAS